MFSFRKNYFIITTLLFLVELAIAIFVHDNIIRPHIGDLLVVILIYCFIRSFLNIPVLRLGLYVLAFAYSVEVLQYFNIVQLLNLQNSKVASVIIGNSFSWLDIIAYSLGIGIVFLLEKIVEKNQIIGDT